MPRRRAQNPRPSITAVSRRRARNPRLSVIAKPRRRARNPHLSIIAKPRRRSRNPRLSVIAKPRCRARSPPLRRAGSPRSRLNTTAVPKRGVQARISNAEELRVLVVTAHITGSVTAYVMRGVSPHYGGILGLMSLGHLLGLLMGGMSFRRVQSGPCASRPLIVGRGE